MAYALPKKLTELNFEAEQHLLNRSSPALLARPALGRPAVLHLVC